LSRLPAIIDNAERFPKRLQLGLAETVIANINGNEEIELSIVLECSKVNLRQFAALLTVIDHFYSRMYYDGIYNYARFEKDQLQVKEFKVGSLEIVINALENHDASRIILLWLLIKYLPAAVVSLSTAVSNFAKAFRDYEDGQQIRETRKALRENLKQDKQLEKLDKRQFARLSNIMAYLYARESKMLIQAEKCITKNVQSVEVRKRKKQKRDNPQNDE
jgi:hypothetical protein